MHCTVSQEVEMITSCPVDDIIILTSLESDPHAVLRFGLLK